MIINEWSQYVNTKFYAYSENLKDNTILTTFLSGRTIGQKINERDIKEIKCSLRLNKKVNEDIAFWNWFSQIGSLAGVFSCPALGNMNYRFTSIPKPQDTDQQFVKLQLEIEEVY